MKIKESFDGIQVGIYKITNLKNGKYYIGQSKELKKRYNSHKNQLLTNSHTNKHLQSAFNKDKDFLFEVIQECQPNELDSREIELISLYKSTNRKFGYNFESGGNTRKTLHKETLKKMSDSMKKYFSDENNKIEASKKMASISIDLVRQIKEELYFTDKDLKFISEKFEVSKNIVVHICKVNCYSYICKDYNKYLENRNKNIEIKNNKKIIRLYMDGLSYKDIANEIDISERNIIKRLNIIKESHHDKIRLRNINRTISKRNSLIKTLKNMGKNTVQISKLLNVSRVTIKNVLNNETIPFESLNQIRCRNKLDYKKKKRCSD